MGILLPLKGSVSKGRWSGERREGDEFLEDLHGSRERRSSKSHLTVVRSGLPFLDGLTRHSGGGGGGEWGGDVGRAITPGTRGGDSCWEKKATDGKTG